MISNHNDDELDNKISCLEDLFNKMDHKDSFKFIVDKETTFSIYLRVIYNPTTISHLSTFENLVLKDAAAKEIFNEIESIVRNVFTESIRFTKSYWLSELGIFL